MSRPPLPVRQAEQARHQEQAGGIERIVVAERFVGLH